MPQNEPITPPCYICGEPIGYLEDTMVTLKGQFFWCEQDGYAPLVLEEDSPFEIVELPDPDPVGAEHHRPQKAMILNPEYTGMIVITHTECFRDAYLAAEDDDVFCEDEEDEELNELLEDEAHLERYYTEMVQRLGPNGG